MCNPWKCVDRCSSGSRTKGNDSKRSIRLWGRKRKTLRTRFFQPFCGLYKSGYHCYPKIISLAVFGDLQRQPSPTTAGERGGQKGVVWMEEGERPLSASLLWSSGCQAAAPQNLLLGSTWPSLLITKDWPTMALCHTSPTGEVLSPLNNTPLPPAYISVLWHKDHLSWKM